MKIEWKTCLKIGVSILLLYLAVNYWDDIAGLLSALFAASFPLLLGAAIAYVINIPMGFFERHYFIKSNKKIAAVSRRPVCMLGAYITVLAVVTLIVWLILPQLGECFAIVLAEFPDMFGKLLGYAENLRLIPESILDMLSSIDWKTQISNVIAALTSGIGNILDSVISMIAGVFSGFITALVSIIFSVYLLLSKDKLCSQWRRVLKRYTNKKWNDKVSYVLTALNDSFHKYIVGQCTEAVILGALCTVGMFIFGFPYALMIGALVAFTALIPIAGAYIGAGVGAFMILTESPLKALLFLVFILVLQQLEGNLIYPKVVGTSIGLPGIWVLAAVTVGGGIYGILGMLLGVPIAATVYRIIREDVNGNESRTMNEI